MSLATNFHQATVVLQVADIEQFIESKPILPAQNNIWLDIVQLTEQGRESYVPSIIQ